MSAIIRITAVLVLALGGTTLALAHGEAVPQRGGILEVVGELDFELVVKADKIDLYVMNDGEEQSTESMSAVATIMDGDEKVKVDMVPAGINRLRASGVTATSGSRVVTIVMMPDGKPIAVQFAVP